MLVEVDLTRQTIHAVEHSQARLKETGPSFHNGIPWAYLTKGHQTCHLPRRSYTSAYLERSACDRSLRLPWVLYAPCHAVASFDDNHALAATYAESRSTVYPSSSSAALNSLRRPQLQKLCSKYGLKGSGKVSQIEEKPPRPYLLLRSPCLGLLPECRDGRETSGV
jgi:hypothetical protein